MPRSMLSNTAIVRSIDGKPLYRLEGSCAQSHFLCPCPRGACREGSLGIYRESEKEGSGKRDGEVGRAWKQWTNCSNLCLASAAGWIIAVDPSMKWSDKLLLIAVVQVIDMFDFGGLCK